MEILENLAELRKNIEADIKDSVKHPEITKVAHARTGKEASTQEKQYIIERKRRARESFAKFIGVDVDQVHPDDIPTIAVTGSGGGMRANVDTMGFVRGMQKDGLWDSVAYFTGVSGACWAIATYYTVAEGSIDGVVQHFKDAYNISPVSPKFFTQLLNTVNGIYLSFGSIEGKKIRGIPVNTTDIYGAVLGGYFFRKNGVMDPKHFKLSSQAELLKNGAHPYPIYTMLCHERPWRDEKEANEVSKCDESEIEVADFGSDHAKKLSHYMWVEFTPYEVSSEEAEAAVPAWAFGRKFDKGVSVDNVPEQNFALEVGYMTCAQCAPIARYVHLADRSLPKNWLGDELRSFSSKIQEKLGSHVVDVFDSHHPIHMAHEYNPFLHTKPPPYKLGISTSEHLHFLDAGMDNNHPWYVATRLGRDVDIIFTIDGSKETMDPTFLNRMASQFSTRRGILWTSKDPPQKSKHPEKLTDELRGHPDLIHEAFKDSYCQIFDGKPINDYGKEILGGRELTLVYLPNLPVREYPNFDPYNEKVCGTSNFVFTPEDIDSIVGIGEACWDKGLEKIRAIVKGAWEKKRDKRLASQ